MSAAGPCRSCWPRVLVVCYCTKPQDLRDDSHFMATSVQSEAGLGWAVCAEASVVRLGQDGVTLAAS